jgi:hypothetical protein
LPSFAASFFFLTGPLLPTLAARSRAALSFFAASFSFFSTGPQRLPVVPAPQGHAAPVRMHAADHRRAGEVGHQDNSWIWTPETGLIDPRPAGAA